MAINFANDLNKGLDYAGVQPLLLTRPKVWFSFFIDVNAWNGTEDQEIFSMLTTAGSATAPYLRAFLDYAAPGSRAKCLNVTLRDSAGSSTIVITTASNSLSATGTKKHVIVLLSLNAAANTCTATIYLDGVSAVDNTPLTGYVDLNGGFDLTQSNLSLGKGVASTPSDHKLEHFAMMAGEPTPQEITDLQTIAPHVALAASGSTILFNPDLTRYSLADRISGTGPTMTTRPVRSLMPGINYGRNATLPVLGDPQHWGEMEVAVPTDTLWSDYAAWVSSYKAALNFNQILNVGDWVDRDDLTAQLVVARAGVEAILATGVEIYGPPGNHDITPDAAPTPDDFRAMVNFSNDLYLPPSLFSTQANFDEFMTPTGRIVGTDDYTYANFWGSSYLVITLPFACTQNQLNFTVAKAAEYPHKKVIVNTHAFLNSHGDVFDNSHTGVGEDDQGHPAYYLQSDTEKPTDPGGTVAGGGLDGWWETHLKGIPNLVAIVGGHDTISIATLKTANRVLTGSRGNNVLCLFVNNQNNTDGGKGLMTFMEFMPDNTIQTESYFALINEFWDGSGNSFAHTIVGASPASSGGLRLGLGIGF